MAVVTTDTGRVPFVIPAPGIYYVTIAAYAHRLAALVNGAVTGLNLRLARPHLITTSGLVFAEQCDVLTVEPAGAAWAVFSHPDMRLLHKAGRRVL